MARVPEDDSSIGSRIQPIDGGPPIRIERPPSAPSRRPSRTHRYSYDTGDRRNVDDDAPYYYRRREAPDTGGRRESRRPTFVSEPEREPTKETYYTTDGAHDELPRHRSRRKPSSRHHAPERKQHDDQDAEDVLNAYYGGTSMGPRPRPDRNNRMHGYTPQNYEGRVGEVEATTYDLVEEIPVGDDDASGQYHLTAPSHSTHQYYWRRAGRPSEGEALQAKICLIVPRHGNRHHSGSFLYTTGPKDLDQKREEMRTGPPAWDDAMLARELKQRYASLKTRDIGLMQKIFAYKKIAYIYVLQSKCIKDDTPYGHWEIVDTSAITSEADGKGWDNFMYKMRYPRDSDRVWTQTIDNFIVRGAVIELEVVETFDGVKVYWGVLIAVLLSLAAGLAYGFAMGNDFSTGFSIASWVLTAFGFFAAVVAAGEYFGLEKPTSFQAGADMEKGDVLPDEWLQHPRSKRYGAYGY